MESLYGKQMMVYNVHSCLHLMRDVTNYGCLDNFSAFPFENFMQKIKGMVRGPNKHLEQVCKRLSEFKEHDKKKPQRIIRLKDGEIVHLQCPSLAGNVVIAIKPPDNWFLLKCNRIIQISKIEKKTENDFILTCRELQEKSDFFTKPLPSSRLSIYKVSQNVSHSSPIFQINAKEIVKKCMLLPGKFPLPSADFICIPYASMKTANIL